MLSQVCLTGIEHGVLVFNPVRDARPLPLPSKWGIAAMLLAVPYFLAANYCITMIEDGGPGWLHLLVLLSCRNALKFVVAAPISSVLLIRVRSLEARSRRRAGRADPHPDTIGLSAGFASNVR